MSEMNLMELKPKSLNEGTSGLGSEGGGEGQHII